MPDNRRFLKSLTHVFAFFNFRAMGRPGTVDRQFHFGTRKSLHDPCYFLASPGRKVTNPRRPRDFRRKTRESLLNPCLGREFADYGQNPIDQSAYRENSLFKFPAAGNCNVCASAFRSTKERSALADQIAATGRPHAGGMRRSRGHIAALSGAIDARVPVHR
jgi:hypothetical protein